MNENRTIKLVEIPFGGKDGFVWNRLHEEREDICESLLKKSEPSLEPALQTRLRTVDDALDRLMSGSYGKCSRCGRPIDDAKLELDLALALCLDCRVQKPNNLRMTEETGKVLLEHLKPVGTDPPQPFRHR